MWYIYIVEMVKMRGKDAGMIGYYTGETYDMDRRWNEHCLQHRSNFMRKAGWRPRRLVYVETLPDVNDRYVAMLRERQIKQLSHYEKREIADYITGGRREIEAVKAA